jgi:hypothetical protein
VSAKNAMALMVGESTTTKSVSAANSDGCYQVLMAKNVYASPRLGEKISGAGKFVVHVCMGVLIVLV